MWPHEDIAYDVGSYRASDDVAGDLEEELEGRDDGNT